MDKIDNVLIILGVSLLVAIIPSAVVCLVLKFCFDVLITKKIVLGVFILTTIWNYHDLAIAE